MPLLTISEAAIRIGYSIELLTYLTKKCPKHGETRILPSKPLDGGIFIDEGELLSYQRYLNEPWPIPPGETLWLRDMWERKQWRAGSYPSGG